MYWRLRLHNICLMCQHARVVLDFKEKKKRKEEKKRKLKY